MHHTLSVIKIRLKLPLIETKKLLYLTIYRYDIYYSYIKQLKLYIIKNKRDFFSLLFLENIPNKHLKL